MQDTNCIRFLQQALPRLGYRWPGYRKVRGQVCKRIGRRITALGLSGLAAYESYLAAHVEEWAVLDAMCGITISRFYRDKSVFARLESEVMLKLAAMAAARGEAGLSCWSAGCASGEEAYSLAMLWRFGVAPRFPGLALRLIATDCNPDLLSRARRGCYGRGSLKDLPADWLARAFAFTDGRFCVLSEFRDGIDFRRQDIRRRMPTGPFDLVLCRNLVFTYFEQDLQRDVGARIKERIGAGGALVLGAHEHLPQDLAGFEPWDHERAIYRKRLDASP